MTHGLEAREREFAMLDVPARPAPLTPATFNGAPVKKIADGFYSIAGAAVDARGGSSSSIVRRNASTAGRRHAPDDRPRQRVGPGEPRR